MNTLLRRCAAVLPVVAACACATGSLTDRPARSPLLASDANVVAQAIREEFRRDRIPVSRSDSRLSVASNLFEPGQVWSWDEVPQRVRCYDREGQPLPPEGRISLRVSATARAHGSGPVTEVWRPGAGLRGDVPFTRIELHSTGYSSRAGSTDRVRCTLSDDYSKDLLLRISSRFPQADTTPGRITSR